MKYLKCLSCRLLFFMIVLTAFSCSKNTNFDELDQKSVRVNFQLIGFSSQILPFPAEATALNKNAATSTGATKDNVERYLYYWSFNADNLLADIMYDSQLSPSISYANGDIPSSFVNSTYTFDNFQAGRALTFAGTKEILIKLPIRNVSQLMSLGFDVGSPGTGPKDFEVYYSVDKGVKYDVLSLVNQFENTNTANQKHTYLFDLSTKNIHAEELWIKIKTKAGERGASGTFNENSGALRMDNLYLKGISSTVPNTNSPDKLHYFLFNKDKSKAVITGVKVLDGSSTLDLTIPVGEYDICFITNDSGTELLLPKNISLETFYVSNLFSNSRANIFGYSGELKVNKETSNQIVLERLFSQVKVEFTDEKGLESVTKIVIAQEHVPYFYAPYNAAMTNPVTDQSSIAIVADFKTNKQLVFNQFMGKLQTLKPVSYKLSIYGKDGLLRVISLSSNLKNNMQLVFTGDILEKVEHNNSFSIAKNETWNGQQTTGF